MSGPLGMALGLFVRNESWVYFFVPREKVVFRFPSEEFDKNTLRRDRFMSLLPLPIEPASFREALLSRVGLPTDKEALEKTQCRFDDKENLYWLRLPNPGGMRGGRWVAVDPVDFYPVKAYVFDRDMPELNEKPERYLAEFQFSQVRGEGPATLPTKIWMGRGRKNFLSVNWREAEQWKNPDLRVFQWQPPASLNLQDY